MFQRLVKKCRCSRDVRLQDSFLTLHKSKMEKDTPSDGGSMYQAMGSPLMDKIPRGRGAPFSVWGMGYGAREGRGKSGPRA